MSPISSQGKHLYEFGPFRLNPHTRTLFHGNDPVALTPKAVEMLVVLVENRDRVVSKDELMKTLWPDSFVEESNLSQNVFLLRKALGDSAQARRYILTVPGRGYQFAETVREVGAVQALQPAAEESLVVERHSLSRVVVEQVVPNSTRVWVGAAVLLLVIGALVTWSIFRRTAQSHGREELLVAEFTNATDDPVFDDTLREVVLTELDRSSVAKVASDDRVPDLLRAMGRAPGTRLTPDVARQVCQQDKGKWLVEGSIKPQGASYLIELATLDCTSGRIESHEQAESKTIDEVLTTLSKLTAATRVQLSGNAGNAEPDAAPLVTSSVQAYKAYLTGYQLMHMQPLQALANLERATQFDSGFADAWYFRGLAHRGLGERQLENEDLARAFALRNRATEMQRQRIEAMYYLEVTGEVYKAIDALRAWESLEPNQFPPHNLLGLPYAELGLYQKAADEYKLTLDLAPEMLLPYLNLGRALQAAGRYDQAQAVLRRAIDKRFDGFSLHYDLYEMALLRSDAAGLEREREWMANNAEDPVVVKAQASIDLLAGNISRARQRTQHAVGMALESKLKEFAAEALLSEATAEAFVGETRQSRHTVAAALQLADSKQERVDAAKALALDGQGSEARQMIERLARENPSDTLFNAVDSPLVLAASQLWNGKAELALRTLEPVTPYEFGTHAGLLPTYLRATAYLQLRRADEATTEFKAVLDHRGVAPMAITWELSQLGLARAYVMQGDTANAHAAYHAFFGLWKDADSDIPILKQAKAEYAKLE